MISNERSDENNAKIHIYACETPCQDIKFYNNKNGGNLSECGFSAYSYPIDFFWKKVDVE